VRHTKVRMPRLLVLLCVLDEAGAIVLEQKLGTTPKAMKEGVPTRAIA